MREMTIGTGGVVTNMGVLEAAIERAVDPTGLMQRVVDETLELVRTADGVSIGLIEGATITGVCGAGRLRSVVGGSFRLGGSLTEAACREGKILHSNDSAADPRVGSNVIELGSLVCVPLHDAVTPIGMLYVTSACPDAFSEADVVILTHVAGFLASIIGRALDCARVTKEMIAGRYRGDRADEGSEVAYRFIANIVDPGHVDRVEAQQRVEAVLDQSLLSMVFQPIVALESGETIGVEALARFAAEPIRPPDVWFAEAHRVGMGVRLEMAAARLAFAALAELPDHAFLSVNAGPETLLSQPFTRLLGAVDPRRVVIELTEHTKIDDYRPIQRVISSLRARGVRLALDDTGAGYAGLNHILTLRPDFIKLDQLITSRIDVDPVRRALATALVSFAAATGATIIAEGIETTAEFDILRGLGIDIGQGYHLGRPGPVEVITSEAAPSSGVITRTCGSAT